MKGALCWLDLAASDAPLAKRFYAEVFGWRFEDQRANGGVFTRCLMHGLPVGSIYQLRRDQLERGVPSHWTPYLRVGDTDTVARRAQQAGGRLVVAPFDVEGVARIALIEDAAGALVGLWGAGPAGPADAESGLGPPAAAAATSGEP